MPGSSCHLIGIAGGSGTGKGFLCRHVQQKLGCARCLILSVDAYYRDLSRLAPYERGSRNFDNPDSLECDLFLRHLEILAAGGAVDLPRYDFATHTRLAEATPLGGAGKIILVEGLFALYWEEARRLFSLRVFLDLDWETCLERRLERDAKERGRTRASVEQQFHGAVLPMYHMYVAPTRQYADLLLSGKAPINESVSRVLQALAARRIASSGE